MEVPISECSDNEAIYLNEDRKRRYHTTIFKIIVQNLPCEREDRRQYRSGNTRCSIKGGRNPGSNSRWSAVCGIVLMETNNAVSHHENKETAEIRYRTDGIVKRRP